MKRISRFCCALPFAVPLALCVACETPGRDVSNAAPTTVTFGATAVLSATNIDFGDAPCGGASPKDEELTLSNGGAVPMGFTASVESPDFSLASPSSGTLDPGQSVTLVVHAAPAPVTSNAGASKTAGLVLTTDDVNQPTITVPLRRTAAGGMLSLQTPADFGAVAIDSEPRSVPLVLTNTGTAPVDVALGEPANPAFTIAYAGSPGPVTLAPGASLPGLTATLTTTRVVVLDASAPLVASGTVCTGAPGTAAPQSVPLRATLTCR